MKITISTLCVLVICQLAIAQNQLTISSGYGVSSTLCGNRKVYTWGNNQQQIPEVTGILGNGSTAALLSTPTEVVFPVSGGVNIKQISSGGGSHFLAVDCNGNVWSWGSNLSGQLGNGNTTTTTLPTLVKPGNGPSANVITNAGTVSALSQVSSVCGGMSNSFAILNDTRLLSWGCNSTNCNPDASGMLGSRTTVNRSTPGFVLSGSTFQPLTGVLQVQAGDNVAYALVDDSSGQGTGIVYSWGNGQNGTLGRNANGTGNSRTLFQVQSSVAFPVRKLDGSALDNIVAISAGAVFCLALDANGYVWAWGNGGWGGCTGQGLTISHSDPRRVIKGNVTGAGTDGTYLLARSIGGGQGFAMAVTLDGKPVAWGNNGGPGGFLGNGATLSYPYPVYVLNNAQTEPHSDVVSVNKGVLNGFYQRANGSIWAWGENSSGELGIGNTTDQLKAVPFTPPTGCTILDPVPYANIFPKDTIVCASRLYTSNPIKLDPKYAIAPSLASNYSVAWYRNDVLIPNTSGTISTKGVTYNANQEGTYRVEINYIGTNGPCVPYTKAISQMVINTFPQTFATPSNLEYCNNTAIVHVNSTSTTNPTYKWYPNTSSQNSIGSSSTSGNVTLDVSSVTAASNGDKIVYVEEKLSASGLVAPKPLTMGNYESSGIVAGNNTSGSGNDMLFVAYENITIDTISLDASTFSGVSVANFQFILYETAYSCGNKLIANRIAPVASGLLYSTLVSSTSKTYKVPVGISVKGSSNGIIYFVGLTSNLNGTIISYSGVPQFTYTSSDMITSNTPFTDNIDGKKIKVFGTDNGACYPSAGTFGSFFNWQFTTGQKFCDRVPVVLKQCTITGQADEDNISSTLMVAPNPFKNYFQLEVPNANKLQVYNTSGELIEEHISLNEGRITIGHNWAKGLYLIQLTGNGTSKKIKVIKED